MDYIEGEIRNGKIVEKSKRTIEQDKMTEECWLIQFKGMDSCESCEFLDTDECGGKKIRESLINTKGHNVPL